MERTNSFSGSSRFRKNQVNVYCVVDILIQKISLDPIGLHGQGADANYIPKFQVATTGPEVA